ncbi:phosphoadenosine phosphosulfate reductase [Nonlabens xylanidelens]|uniref:Phosphoadenosine phosphosulfate reductase n=1 Tax=Nonlabens xylanidelens TaxID=191564 RepID=A0A2S6IPQ8_9FLAO|nr:phosphoadenosine phosphosulfate reductase family protein [Nonlabens xylanidelens]PPK96242.1 phosphoadenosine phosphosulfate reductase [Nonlabens xylanidelens]PQJ17978.1 phosphoadenylylsulfate reductase [Nonlabens xylanidelens]
MKKINKQSVQKYNEALKNEQPLYRVSQVLEEAVNPIITTNFRPYEVAILHLITQVKKDIPVIWCDTGYNTIQTYKHVEYVRELLDLNLKIYVPKQSVAYRNVIMGIPELDNPSHALFSEQVKLEPFKRAMKEWSPDVWFTNLRKGQTAFRDSIDVLSYGANDVLKVSPFYDYDDNQLDEYLEQNNLKNEFKYYDPTKVIENRECGIHN